MIGFKHRILMAIGLVISLPAAAASFESGGLGMARSEFISKYGPEDKQCALTKQTGGLYSCFKAGRVELPLMDTKNVSDFQLVWPRALSLEESRALATPYIPSDSRKVKTYLTDYGSTVDLYHSASLAKRFAAKSWHDKPGEFIVIYSVKNRKTIVGINNNP
ncbi:hypothetical protein [Crenobacter luteus]|uniref:hypothetical protein n=1 Tax=Crenobacter luteus TaxID=1452487 RepID=UPI00104296D3|nr:hypothetical protein [Crenobacter luteus]